MRRSTYQEEIDKSYDSVSLDSDYWTLYLVQNGALTRHNLDFSSQPISPARKELAKKFLLEYLKDVNYCAGNPGKSSICKLKRVFTLLASLEKMFPGRKLYELDQNSLESWVCAAMFCTIEKDSSNGRMMLVSHSRPFGRGFLASLILIYRLLYKYYQEGRCSEGPERLITQPVITKRLEADLSALDLSIHDWQSSKPFGSIPFLVANLLMADALQVLQSKETTQLLIYFNTVRKLGRPDVIRKLWTSSRNSIRKYRFTSDTRLLKRTFGNDDEAMVSCKKLLLTLDKNLREASGPDFIFPWPIYTDLQRDYATVLFACFIICLFVMGKRGGELRPLKASDIHIPEKAKDSATVTYPNYKTNNGIRSTQGVTDLIASAYDVLLSMRYVDIRGTEAPLFCTLPFLTDIRKPNGVISHEHLNRGLQLYYEQFIVRAESQVEISIKDIHPTISPHQFRHTFAEFALRRFDGNVLELLRQTFRHGKNIHWIQTYSLDKLDDELRQRLNREYLAELIPRVLREQDDIDSDYVGGMAVYIKTVIRPKTKHMTPAEFEEYISTVTEDFDAITPHEYGWCMLLKKFSSQAKCSRDGVSPAPKSTDVTKCNGCVNFLCSKKAHLQTQQSIAMSHIDFIESEIWKLPDLKQRSIQAVKEAQRLFPELKSLGEF